MGWYIKQLSDDEKRARRESLDATGLLSCLASFFILIGLAGVRAYRRSQKQDSFPPTISRFGWRFSYAPAFAASPELGTVGMWISAVGYTVWQLYLGIGGTNEDYIHLTKAFGTLAASNLPLLFFLSGKSRSFLHRHLIHYSHDRINVLHRWLGRLIFTFITFHATLYLNYFWVTGQLSSILDWDIMFGVAGFFMLATIYVTSLSLIRHAPSVYFTLFYFTHIVLAIALLPIIWNHVSHPHPYLLFAACLWIWDYTSRWFFTRWGQAEIKLLRGGRMIEVDVIINRPEKIEISPGAHVFLTIPRLHRIRGGMRANPFTVAAFSEDEQRVKLVMRVRDGFTRSLVELTQRGETSALSSATADDEQALQVPASIFLPSQASFPNLLQYTRVLLIGGGVGGSFCVPWVKHLHSQPPTGTNIRFVWAVSDPLDTHWAFTEMKDTALRNFTSSLELYITGTGGGRLRGEAEMELLPRTKNALPSSLPASHVRYSRPNVSQVLEQELDACLEGDDMAVLVCGPEGMTTDVRDAVGRTIDNRKGVGVWYWQECFGY